MLISMDITPNTPINTLLQAYPQLEQVLIDLNPKFKKLKNPVLRNSIGRVARLEQAANMVNLPPAELVNKLRRAVGQSPWV